MACKPVRKEAGKTIGAPAALMRCARSIICRRIALCVQIVAIALAMTTAPGARPSSDRHSDGRGQTVSATAENCAAMAGDAGPSRPAQTHTQCCFVCTSAARELLSLFIAAFCLVAFGAVRQSSSRISYLFDPFCAPSVPGWGSSWSSRAPPALA